jgi:hypothetical protein
MEHVVIFYVYKYSVMLYLRHDIYKIIFKIKHILYFASGSDPPPPPNPPKIEITKKHRFRRYYDIKTFT